MSRVKRGLAGRWGFALGEGLASMGGSVGLAGLAWSPELAGFVGGLAGLVGLTGFWAVVVAAAAVP